MASTVTEALRERLDHPAEAWRPEPGDRLVGTVVDRDERTSQFDEEPYPIVTVRVAEGSTEAGGATIEPGDERAFHGFRTVARREIERRNPRLGDYIGIAFDGRHTRGYDRYVIRVERGADSPPGSVASESTGEPVAGDAAKSQGSTEPQPEGTARSAAASGADADIPF